MVEDRYVLMTAAFYCAVFIAVGFLVGRWWALAAVLPAFYSGAYEVPIENSEPPYWDVGFGFGLIAVAAIAVAPFAVGR